MKNYMRFGAAVVCVISSSSYGAIISVDSLHITGGQILFQNSQSFDLLVGDIASLEMGEVQGAPACCSPAVASSSLVYYQFSSFGWAGIHTSQNDSHGSTAAAPSGYVDTDSGSVVLDLSAWTWSFNGLNDHQGENNIVGSYDVNTGTFDISWSSVIEGGSFNSYTNDWHLYGTVNLSAVPLPGSAWLFASGVLGAGLAMRRRIVN